MGEHAINFKINDVTPKLLKKVFQLDSAPEFLISETTGDLTMIEGADLTENDHFIIDVLDVRNMPRIDPGT